jgi:hypothetical protein
LRVTRLCDPEQEKHDGRCLENQRPQHTAAGLGKNWVQVRLHEATNTHYCFTSSAMAEGCAKLLGYTWAIFIER